MARPRIDPEKRINKFKVIDPITNCWLWTGTLDKDGYAKFSLGTRSLRLIRYIASKYLNLSLDNPKEFACHNEKICNNKTCFNPDHLYVGNSQTNNFDKGIKVTHCPQGHKYTKENTRIGSKWERQCRECARIRDRKRRANCRSLLTA